MLNVLQLAAGKGSRFKHYTHIPKPYITVDGEPMFYKAFKTLGLKNCTSHSIQ